MFSELLREITDLTPWKESIDAYISNLSINSVIVTVMMIFMLLGAIDKARGNKHGYGAAFMFGDHLGFVAGVNADMIVPMIFAKLACGLSALALANLLAPQLLSKAQKAAEND
ncbi:ethanolamine utilization protein EutH [Butyricicoccus intestinisimiae]